MLCAALVPIGQRGKAEAAGGNVNDTVNREEIGAVLRAWCAGERDERFVWEWAQSQKAALKEAGEKLTDDLARDIIDVLETLPFDVITTEDAEVMLDAMANPPDETDLSLNLLWNHLDAQDADYRRRQLGDHPFYGEFHREIY